MVKKNWDAIVVGGGIAGLTITLLLSKLKLNVLCIEPHRPASKKETQFADLRSTAYLLKSVDLFKQAGVWESLQIHAEALKIMRICDVGTAYDDALHVSDFDSQEIDLPCFGYNVPNWFAKTSLIAEIEASEFGEIIFGQKVTGFSNQINNSFLKLENNINLSAKLIIAADGKNSEIRYLSKIKIKKWDNSQDAIACVVLHEKPHVGSSTEVLDSGGPCTLVPMKNSQDKKFQSAVVWMESRHNVKKLMLLNDDDFSKKLSARTKYLLGSCELNSRRTTYPIVTQLAERFYCTRLALIAESAHVMPPIGAQGLNTSFEDILLLVNLIKSALSKKVDIGSLSVLKEYGQRRRRLVQSKMLGVFILNQTSKSNLQITKNLRRVGLKLIGSSTFIKTTLMKAGLGKFN